MSEIIINGSNLSLRYYNASPVITFEEIDMVHQRSPGSARRNFTNNGQHFVEGVDYYLIPLEEYRDLYDRNYLRKGGNPTLRKTLLTVTGYCLLAKTFNDDLSWDIQRALVANYFFGSQQDKGDIYAFLRQTINIMESQSKSLDLLASQVNMINQSIVKTKQLQLELFDNEKPERLLNPTQVAMELRLHSEKGLPHQRLVKAIAAQAGIRTSSDTSYEDDYVHIERTREANNINIVVVNVLFKPAAVQKIKDWFESVKDYAYFENFYQKKSKRHQPGDLKNRGYRIGKRNYYIA